jgi:hypothetical protein
MVMGGNTFPIQSSSQQEITEESIGERRLWLAVLTQAVQDWRNGTLRAHREAQHFLFDDSVEFIRVCASAGLDPASLRSKLMKIGRRIEMQGPLSKPVAA